MAQPSWTPVASPERLKELGLDPSEYGSCSMPQEERIPGRGRKIANQGCYFYPDCEWAHNTKHMDPKDENDVNPRPRHVRTRFIKPKGRGHVKIDNYCACFRWHADLKRRDGLNGEIAQVTGGEGDVVELRTSERITRPDGSVIFRAGTKEETIPPFPDPTEDDELASEVSAAKAATKIKQQRDTVRLAGFIDDADDAA